MPVPSHQLIGTGHWDPFGESLLTIVEKIAVRNHLSLTELTRLVGFPSIQAFSAVSRSRPDRRTSVAIDPLARLAGWPVACFDASFTSYYRLPGSATDVMEEDFFRMAGGMRLCIDCATEGVHLLLHQLRDFGRCPIHRSPLRERCPDCGKALGTFRFPPDEHHSMRCGQCSWNAWDGVRETTTWLMGRKRAMIDEYLAWCATIDSVHRGFDPARLLVDRPRRMASLANLEALVPGPPWLRPSLAAAGRVRRVAVDLRSSRGATRGTEGRIREDPIPAAGRLVDGAGTALARQQQRTILLVDRLERTLVPALNPLKLGSGARLTRFGYHVYFSERTSVAALGLLWWRHLLAPIAETDERRRAGITVSGELQSHCLWSLWRAGPGRVLQQGSGWCAQASSPLVDEVGSVWMERLLRDLALALIGRASRVDGGPVQRHGLLEEAYGTDAMPLSMLEMDGPTLRFVTATRLAPEEDFLALFRSGYTGFPSELVSSVQSNDPMCRLLGWISAAGPASVEQEAAGSARSVQTSAKMP